MWSHEGVHLMKINELPDGSFFKEVYSLYDYLMVGTSFKKEHNAIVQIHWEYLIKKNKITFKNTYTTRIKTKKENDGIYKKQVPNRYDKEIDAFVEEEWKRRRIRGIFK